MYTINEITSNKSFVFLKIAKSCDTADVFGITLAKEFVPGLELAVGDTLDEERFLKIAETGKLTFAVTKALDVLSHGNQSRRALVIKLRKKYNIEKKYAEAAADYAERRGYIDETAQAAREAEISVRTKGRGKKRIAADLAAKGYSKNAIYEALGSIDDEICYASLKAVIKKKFKNPPQDESEFRKAALSLTRLGHGYGDIERAFFEIYGGKYESEE